jgi:hypothetical protein
MIRKVWGEKSILITPVICYKINQFIIRSSKSVLVLNFIDELKIRSLNIKLGQLCKQVKDNMCNSFLDF